ncbi:MAG: hypothetical protein Q8L23_03640 [Caulobacter sp.]|nr:hypothetical protein [Caulobacter sp.]
MLDLQPELTLGPETAFHIMLKAREFDAKVEERDAEPYRPRSTHLTIAVLLRLKAPVACRAGGVRFLDARSSLRPTGHVAAND